MKNWTKCNTLSSEELNEYTVSLAYLLFIYNTFYKQKPPSNSRSLERIINWLHGAIQFTVVESGVNSVHVVNGWIVVPSVLEEEELIRIVGMEGGDILLNRVVGNWGLVGAVIWPREGSGTWSLPVHLIEGGVERKRGEDGVVLETSPRQARPRGGKWRKKWEGIRGRNGGADIWLVVKVSRSGFVRKALKVRGLRWANFNCPILWGLVRHAGKVWLALCLLVAFICLLFAPLWAPILEPNLR